MHTYLMLSAHDQVLNKMSGQLKEEIASHLQKQACLPLSLHHCLQSDCKQRVTVMGMMGMLILPGHSGPPTARTCIVIPPLYRPPSL